MSDELETQLKKRDGRFLIRLVLSLCVVILAGVYGILMLGEADLGGCTARGFQTLTDPGDAAP